MTTTPQVPGALTDERGLEAFEAKLKEQKYVLGMPELAGARTAFLSGWQAARTALATLPEPAAAPAAGEPAKQRSSIPAGWRIERLDDKPFKGIGIATPDGKSCIVWSHNRNPENVLYALAEALIGRNTDE